MARKKEAQICNSVKLFRAKCGEFGLIEENGQIDLAGALEYLERIWDEWGFCVEENEVMGNLLGKACPSNKMITLRRDVYDGLAKRDPEHTFTVAHELGHMVMHSELEFARREGEFPPENTLRDVEEEADLFAQTLLGFNSPLAEQAKQIQEEVLQMFDKILKGY